MRLDEIKFPVYLLGNDEPMHIDGIWFYSRLRDHDDRAPEVEYLILEDKTRHEPTFSRRRMGIKLEGAMLYPLTKAIFFLGDFLKFTKGKTWFIDTDGTVFSYKKTKRVPLIFKKITKIIHIQTGGAIIECEGSAARYKVLFRPMIEHKWAGLLKVSGGYILYGLYDNQYKNTYRMI